MEKLSIEKFMAENLKPFCPSAYFDERTDQIRVVLKDCTMVSIVDSQCLTIMQRSGSTEQVGFVIESATELFSEPGVAALVGILNRILLETAQP